MDISILPKKYVLNSPVDDFIKMFLPTLLLAISFLFFDSSRSEVLLFLAFYFIDAGHIYSSFLELIFDKNEFKKKQMILISLFAISLNLFATYALPGNFFVYLFYFTIFHNLRQGLGVFLIYFEGSNRDREIQRYLYYFGTIIPVFIFHFKGMYLGSDATYTLRPFDLLPYFSRDYLQLIFSVLSKIYFVAYFGILIYLIKKKQAAFFSFLFFTAIYSVSFLLFDNVIWAMLLLVFSHGIPYYFLFNKRIKLTHSSINVRKFSAFFVFLFFVIGAIFELTQEDVSGIFPPHISNIIAAIIFYPMTVHYIFDSFIWKKGNERYEIFKSSIRRVQS
jgi:hypothetical protein